ncbi:MAG TPA: DEAD/DEAH box helicase, partial [Spirochaetota bacterium]|nr:DEAD/DEAH box helicase [Spirochaetota bacterium]
MSFEKLNLIEPIVSVLKEEGYERPTPIQSQAIPLILEKKDILGCAQTGTGKTAAFALPILQLLCMERDNLRLTRTIKSLILTPTRELAIQIGESFTTYGKNIPLRNGVIFGGVPQKRQTDKLQSGIDILIATPGRLLDLMNQKYVDLSHIKIFVLDEADRMLDMGFFRDVKKIIAKLPQKKQTLLFSATMPSEISELADSLLVNPLKLAVTPVSSTVEIIDQSVYYVNKSNKKSLLIHLLKYKTIESALIFSRTKHGSNRIVEDLNKAGIGAEAIHGNKSQNARQNALSNFKTKQIRVLVATDIAARGIDIDELSHVINYDIPNVPETYVHRIGRTGRAGLSGTAISFCEEEEKLLLKNINKLISKPIPVVTDHPFVTKDSLESPKIDIFKDRNKAKSFSEKKGKINISKPKFEIKLSGNKNQISKI